VFCDIGLVHDPTVIAIGHSGAGGLIYIDKLITHQGSRRRPVDLGRLRAELRSIAEVWNARIRIESWQGETVAQDLARGGVRADIRTPTSSSQAELRNTLAAALGNHQVALPQHDRLREELLDLRVELRAGGDIRVTDRGRVHQDHAVAVAGVVEMVLRGRRRSRGGRMTSHVPRGRIDTMRPRTFAERAGLRRRNQSSDAGLAVDAQLARFGIHSHDSSHELADLLGRGRGEG